MSLNVLKNIMMTLATVKNWLRSWWDYFVSAFIRERWLSQVVRKELKRRYTIQERFWLTWETAKYAIKGSRSWRYVILILLALFVLCLWSFVPAIVIVEREEVLDILEKRLTNFIAIFGMSITVATFIVNIIRGRQNGEGYNTVLVEAGFYPVLYTSLGTIGILALISSYRNLFGAASIKWFSDDVLIRMIFLGAWLFTLLLIAVGWLFLRLYRFLNTDELRLRRLERMRSLAYKEMFQEIRQRRSLDVYTKFVQSLGFRESYWSNVYRITTRVTLDDLQKKWSRLPHQETSLVLKDINIAGIKRIHSQKIKHLYQHQNRMYQALYEGFSLDKSLLQETTLLTFIYFPPKGIEALTHKPDSNNNTIDKDTARSLAKQFVAIVAAEHTSEYRNELQILHEDLIKASGEGNLIALNSILKVYQEIYQAAGELYKNFVAPNRIQYPSAFYFWDKWYSVSECLRSIDSAMEIAQKKNQIDVFNALHYHFAYVLVDAAKNSFWVFFGDYAERLRRSYIYLKEFSVKKDSSLSQAPDIIKNMGLIIRQNILYTFDREFSRILRVKAEIEEDIIACYNAAYKIYSDLMQQIIERRDEESFLALLSSFQDDHHIPSDYINEIRDEIDKLSMLDSPDDNTRKQLEDAKRREKTISKLFMYKHYAIFAVFTWIFFRYYREKISLEQLRKFIPENFFQINQGGFEELFYTRFFNSAHMATYYYLNEILPLIEQADNTMNFSQWSWNENISPSYWLWIGVVIGLLNREDLDSPRLDAVEDCQALWNAPHTIDGICNDVIRRSEEWAVVFNKYDKAEIERRCGLVSKLFTNLQERLQRKLEREIIEAPLNDVIVQEVKEDIYKAYKENNFQQSSLRLWAKKFEAEEPRHLSDNKNAHIFYANQVIMDMKKLFVNVNLPYALSNHRDVFIKLAGGDYSQPINDKFIKVILSAASPKTVNDYAQGIIDSVQNLKSKGFSPNLILHAGVLLLFGDRRFIHNSNNAIYGVYYYLDNIPISSVRTLDPNWSNKIVVCDFAKAFRLCGHINDEWYDQRINIQVREVTESQAQIEAQNEGLTPNTEEFVSKVHSMRLGMSLMIEEYVDFEVLDTNAFEVLDFSKG